jgi:hypothetical protein
MAPAKAITEIKVLQTGGFNAGGNAAPDGSRPALGAMSPILKSILEAGAAYPLLREIMSFAQTDGGKLTASVQSALGELTAELKAVLKKEERAPASNGGAIDVRNEDILQERQPGALAGE